LLLRQSDLPGFVVGEFRFRKCADDDVSVKKSKLGLLGYELQSASYEGALPEVSGFCGQKRRSHLLPGKLQLAIPFGQT
jgi:hypothetical protein